MRTVLLLVITSCAASAQAQALCPWLSTGSAETALAGEVTVTAHSANNWDGSCRFTRKSASAMTIDIQVSKVDSHPCPEGSPKLKALGNEAMQCLRSTSSGERTEIIAAKVRDAYFVITATGLSQTEPYPQDDRPVNSYGAPLLERLAEQVAGNLY